MESYDQNKSLSIGDYFERVDSDAVEVKRVKISRVLTKSKIFVFDLDESIDSEVFLTKRSDGVWREFGQRKVFRCGRKCNVYTYIGKNISD